MNKFLFLFLVIVASSLSANAKPKQCEGTDRDYILEGDGIDKPLSIKIPDKAEANLHIYNCTEEDLNLSFEDELSSFGDGLSISFFDKQVDIPASSLLTNAVFEYGVPYDSIDQKLPFHRAFRSGRPYIPIAITNNVTKEKEIVRINIAKRGKKRKLYNLKDNKTTFFQVEEPSFDSDGGINMLSRDKYITGNFILDLYNGLYMDMVVDINGVFKKLVAFNFTDTKFDLDSGDHFSRKDIKLLNIKTKKFLDIPEVGPDHERFSPQLANSQLVFASVKDNKYGIYSYNLKTKKMQLVLENLPRVKNLQFNGRYIACEIAPRTSIDRFILIHDVSSKETRIISPYDGFGFKDLRLAKNKITFFASKSRGDTANFYDINKDEVIEITPQFDESRIRNLYSNGKYLAWDEGRGIVLDMDTRKAIILGERSPFNLFDIPSLAIKGNVAAWTIVRNFPRKSGVKLFRFDRLSELGKKIKLEFIEYTPEKLSLEGFQKRYEVVN